LREDGREWRFIGGRDREDQESFMGFLWFGFVIGLVRLGRGCFWKE